MLEKKEFEISQERAVLVGAIQPDNTEEQIEEYLDELSFLAETAGATTERIFTQKIDRPNPKYFIGSGKVHEIADFIKDSKADLVIFDDELSPVQFRNLEKAMDCKVLDRSNLILDIFSSRAKTAHAKTQVELAQYEYLLPRLTRMWTHLQKQKGGIGMKGPGETEIETDRRIIRDKIALLKKKLAQIDKQKATQRGNRGALVRVALVGYTNAGKSTLMNRLSKSDVFAEDKLFATLDTTVRKVVIGNLPFLLTDTVGFIRKLPHQLVESFKSTLDEVRESDLLLHVIDVSHPEFEDHMDVVHRTLNEIGAGDKPMIIVFNKVDQYKVLKEGEFDHTGENDIAISLDDLEKTWMAKKGVDCIFISAYHKTNLPAFRDLLYERVKEINLERYPYNNFLY
jgi:GTP-binding protein HflX